MKEYALGIHYTQVRLKLRNSELRQALVSQDIACNWT